MNRQMEIRVVVGLLVLFVVMAVHQLWCTFWGTCLRPVNAIFTVVTFYGFMGAAVVVMRRHRRVTLPRVAAFMLAVTFVLANWFAMRLPVVLRRMTFSQFTVWFILYMGLQFFVGLVVLPKLLPRKSKDQDDI